MKYFSSNAKASLLETTINFNSTRETSCYVTTCLLIYSVVNFPKPF